MADQYGSVLKLSSLKVIELENRKPAVIQENKMIMMFRTPFKDESKRTEDSLRIQVSQV